MKLHLHRALLALPLLAGLSGGALAGDVCDADSCALADTITGLGTFDFDNSAATTDGAPDAACLAFGQDQIENDVWCVWTATVSGAVTVETCGLTAVDTRIAVYDGSGCVGTLLACNDDTCGLQSSVSFVATSGNEYMLRIGTFPGAAGGTGSFSVLGDDFPDCDNDGIPDSAETDCDVNGVPDDCEVLPDCNNNGIPDACDLCEGSDLGPGKGGEDCSIDCNGNSIPDECELEGNDCNENGIPDECDICPDTTLGGCSDDCNQNGVPDECEPDCDGDGIPDECDLDSCEQTDLACEEFDRFEDLTPNDTLSVITTQHNPQQEQGFLYVFAVTPANQPVAADWLVGQQLVVDGLEAFQYSINPVDYRAAVGAGELTDLDGDGVRDLDDAEYEETAGEILVPRFLGSDPQRQTRGQLILIGLSGGSQFTTTADFLVYNDDEDQFSANHTFFCWDKVRTLDVSNVFANQWLKDFSGQNPSKGLGNLEYGWFSIDGGVASSSFYSIEDPALYAVYVEQVGGTAAADLPFERGAQAGHLLPRTVSGDNSESGAGPGGETGLALATGRKPASLLLFPEFDNRAAVATVVTVTNTSPTEDVRVHYVYIGRFGN